MVYFSCLAMAPDCDVISFRLGIPYSAPFGHRGAVHSLVFALAIGLIAGLLAYAFVSRGSNARDAESRAGIGSARIIAWSIAVVATHGLLDTLTDGGLGVALLWPFTNARYFAPWRPIPVAPIGARMLSARGLHVVLVEALELLPLLAYALWPGPKRSA